MPYGEIYINEQQSPVQLLNFDAWTNTDAKITKDDQSDKNISCDIQPKQIAPKIHLINVETNTSNYKIEEAKKLPTRSISNSSRKNRTDEAIESLISLDSDRSKPKVQEKALSPLKVETKKPELVISREIMTQECKPPPQPGTQEYIKSHIHEMNNALKQKEKDQILEIKSLLRNNEISGKTFKHHKEMIEKWVDAEKQQIRTTKKILLQGWMKANEIMNHLEQDKNDVNMMIYHKRAAQGSNSNNNSYYSAISNCRSDSSFSQVEKSSATNLTVLHKPQKSTDFDI